MTEHEKRDILSFGRANLLSADMRELERLIEGEYANDPDACRGFVYAQTPTVEDDE